MIVVVTSAIIVRNNEALFVRETKNAAKDKYGLPGGKLEPGESLEECLIRECKEETGLDIQVIDLVAVTQKPHTHENNNVVRFFYTASITNEPPSSAAEMETAWLDTEKVNNLAQNNLIRGRDVRQLVTDHLTKPLPKISKPQIFD